VKQSSLTKLEAIAAQANNLHTTDLFFQLLDEFSLTLLSNPHLQDMLSRISAREKSFQEWFDAATESLPHENRDLYLAQHRNVTAFYALKQIKIFFERHNFAFYDTLVKQLKEQGIDVSKLQAEHSELVTYRLTGKCPRMFPTIEEYKHYMRRIVWALREELARDLAPTIPAYPFKFDKRKTSLLIGSHKPVKFTRNKNPSVLLGYLSQNGWKDTPWKTITNDLDLDADQIERTIRQTNDRLPDSLPEFLTASDHPDKLDEKIVTVSPAYKLSC
jgi:hypothetical protein